MIYDSCSSDLHPVVAGTPLVGTTMAALSWLDGAGAYSILGEIGRQPVRDFLMWMHSQAFDAHP